MVTFTKYQKYFKLTNKKNILYSLKWRSACMQLVRNLQGSMSWHWKQCSGTPIHYWSVHIGTFRNGAISCSRTDLRQADIGSVKAVPWNSHLWFSSKWKTRHNLEMCISSMTEPMAMHTKRNAVDPSFPYFLPYLFLTCCTIPPTSFAGKESYSRRTGHTAFINGP